MNCAFCGELLQYVDMDVRKTKGGTMIFCKDRDACEERIAIKGVEVSEPRPAERKPLDPDAGRERHAPAKVIPFRVAQ